MVDGVGFDGSFDMAGVADDEKKPAGAEVVEGLIEGGDGGVGMGDERFITARQVTEIEQGSG